MLDRAKKTEYVGGKPNLMWINPNMDVYFDIPGWPGYMISNRHNVYNKKTEQNVKCYETYPGKPQRHVFLVDEYGKRHKMDVSRLFRKTFYLSTKFGKDYVQIWD